MHGRLVFLALAVAMSCLACLGNDARSAFDQRQCAVGRLDHGPDPGALFAPPGVPCVIVTWDTEMDGAGVGPDGSISTPPALTAAASSHAFASPCETNVSPQGASPARAWFVTRFGALDPRAEAWGVTLFVPTPIPDGVHPGCAAVTPPSP